jgi:hypothetical protein
VTPHVLLHENSSNAHVAVCSKRTRVPNSMRDTAGMATQIGVRSCATVNLKLARHNTINTHHAQRSAGVLAMMESRAL